MGTKQLSPEFVSDSSLNWALEHISRFGDTDVFPISFEFRPYKSVWPGLLDALRKIDLAKHELGPPIRMMVPKHTTGYRCAAQIDPLDALLFSALVYEMSSSIEAFRLPVGRNRACAYRFDVKPDGQFFQQTTGRTSFHEQSKTYAEQSWCKHVISADIRDRKSVV